MTRGRLQYCSLRATCAVLLATSGRLGAQTTPYPDSARAREALLAYARACRLESTRWPGGSLCGPLVLVDPASRAAFANRSDPGRTFTNANSMWVGKFPANIALANTSIDWQGTPWATAMLPLDDSYVAAALLVHESFHRIQDSLHLRGRDTPNNHLDERDGRLWLRLELHALAYALTTRGDTARGHARNALLFRRFRNSIYPGSDSTERELELQEGLPEYVGAHAGLATTGIGALRVVRAMDGVERSPTLVRSFAYASGPALGLLLDRFDPGWPRRVARVRSLAQLLEGALGTRGGVADTAALRRTAEQYGYRSVLAQETERDEARKEALARYRERFLNGPVLVLRQDGLGRSFDPNNLAPFDTLGTVYPTGSFTAAWGTLEVTKGGALVSRNFRLVRLSAPVDISGATVKGDGWELRLADGWEVRRIANTGNSEVVRKP